MKKFLNRILKLVGINVVKAKKTRAPRKSKVVYIPGPCGPTGATGAAGKDCTPSPTTCCADAGKTHYVGDECPGGHRVGHDNIAIGYQSKAFVVNPNAAFVPVDIGPSGPCGGAGVAGIACPNQDNNT